MKLIHYICSAMLLAATMAATSCSDDYTAEEVQEWLPATEYYTLGSFSNDVWANRYGDANLYVGYAEQNWKLSDLPNWVTGVNGKNAGNSYEDIYVSVSPAPVRKNDQDYSRHAIFQVTSSNLPIPLSKAINITQDYQDLVFKGSYDGDLLVESEGGTRMLSLQTNAPWKAYMAEGADFVTIDKTCGTGNMNGEVENVTLTFAPNTVPSSQSRTARIEFESEADGSILYCEYEQLPPDITVQQDEYNCTNKAGSKEFDFGACTEFFVETQTGLAVIIPDKPEKHVQYAMNRATQYVEGSWLSVTPESGTGRAKFTVSVTENSNPSSRYAVVYVYVGNKENASASKLLGQVSVSQDGVVLTKPTGTSWISPKGGDLSFEFYSNGPWKAETSDDWLSITPTTGTGYTTDRTADKITVNVKENLTQSTRKGKITLSRTDNVNLSQTITITQDSYTLHSDITEVKLPSTPATSSIYIECNGSWTAKKTASWLTLSKTSGTGYAEFAVTVADNPSVNERTDTITFTASNGIDLKIAVTQAPRYLECTWERVAFFEKGGTQSIDVATDGKVSIKTDASWVSAKMDEGKLIITAEASDGTEREASITLTLTDVTDGEIKHVIAVQQMKSNYIVVQGYGNDKDLNKQGGSTVKDVSVGEYGEDKNLNPETSGKSDIDANGYGEDKDLNQKTEGSSNIGIGAYGEDKDINAK